MSTACPKPEGAFDAVAAALLPEPDVDEGTGFGTNPGLRVGGKIFAMLVGDELVVKLPADRCAELVAAGSAQMFEVGRRRMREWVRIAEVDEKRWRHWRTTLADTSPQTQSHDAPPYATRPGGTMTAAENALAVACAYHENWTSGRFDDAAGLLAPELKVEVPINEYPTRESFAEALASFGAMATRVTLLSELGHAEEAMLLFDMDVQGLGPLRVAEHFTVADRHITRLRQIHDTAALRAAGFAQSH